MSYKDFERDWKINFEKRMIQRVVNSTITKYHVSDFYKWIRMQEASFTEGMSYPHILETDGMGSTYAVANKIKLVNNYFIEADSIKYLHGGNLILLDNNNNVLVEDSLHQTKWWDNSYFQIIMFIIAFVGIILAII